MIEYKRTESKLEIIDTDRNIIMCTIESLGNDIYKATNKFTQITAEIKPIDDFRTMTRCVENKKVDKNGKYRKTKVLAEHNTSWLRYMLEEYGFIRKTKTIKEQP